MKSITAILLLWLASCGPSPVGACMDCGPCGIVGGPNEADGIVIGACGVDAAGTPTVELATWRQGECAGQNGETFWLRWEGDTIALELRGSPGGLDTSAVSHDGDVCTWGEPPLQMMNDDNFGAERLLHFIENGVTTDVACSLEAGTVVCDVR